MGRRYVSVLNHIESAWSGYDARYGKEFNLADAAEYDSFVIATPTKSHAEWIEKLADFGKPIFCEKPITKNIEELEYLLELCEQRGARLYMASQYSELVDGNDTGNSMWNFYNSGQDDLPWDCIQIIGLSRGTVLLNDASPIWKCVINGQSIDKAKMDWAYVENMKNFLLGYDGPDILSWHKKVMRFAKEAQRTKEGWLWHP